MSLFSSTRIEKAYLRFALGGPPGAGKSRTALEIATGLVSIFGGKIAVLDTEHGSAAKMRPRFTFDDGRISDYSVDNYIRFIKDAVASGYTVLVLDSLSHAWIGKGGILDMVDNGGGKFNKWKDATPKQRELFETINASPIHIIATMRLETAYVMEKQKNRDGREVDVPVVIGVKPIQRKDSQYEFDIYATMDRHHSLRVEKSRCESIDGKEFSKPGQEFGVILAEWLKQVSGEPATPTIPMATPEQAAEMTALQQDIFGKGPEFKQVKLDHFKLHSGGTERPSLLTFDQMGEYLRRLKEESDLRAFVNKTYGDDAAEVLAAALHEYGMEQSAAYPTLDALDVDEMIDLHAKMSIAWEEASRTQESAPDLPAATSTKRLITEEEIPF